MLPKAQQSDSKMAEYKAPPPPIPSARDELPQSSPAPALVRPQTPASSEPVLSAESRTMAEAVKQRQSAGGVTAIDGLRSRDTAGSNNAKQKDSGRAAAASSQVSAAVRGDLDAKNLREEAQKKETASADAEKLQAEAAQLQQQNAQNYYNQNVTPKVAGPSAMNQMTPPSKAKSSAASPGAAANTAAAPPPAPTPGAPVEANGAVSSYASKSSEMSLKVARAVSNPRLILSPNLQSLWRVGRNGLIEVSKDSGATWSHQASGVTSDLLAGVAPTDQVCWIVGKSGAILVTTDGGVHWKSVSSSMTEDLGGVRAADALHATIWNARGTKSFLTSDGGLTWSPVPHP
jgi:hypothetical protein